MWGTPGHPLRTVDAMHRARGRAGFTLIELLIVIVLLGILIAVAVPTFQNAQERGQAASAQSELKTTLDIAQGEYTFQANGRYPSSATLVNKLNESEDELLATAYSADDLRGATPIGTWLGNLETAATGGNNFNVPAPDAGTVGVYVFDYDGSTSAAPTHPEGQGNALLLARQDVSRNQVVWWVVSNRSEDASESQRGEFYGASINSGSDSSAPALSPAPTWRDNEGSGVSGGVTYPTVTGGSLTSDATYYYRAFTSNGTLVVSDSSLTVDLLVVGGGGGGGVSYGGGGGAGGVLTPTSVTLAPSTYSAVIGAGGAGAYLDTNTYQNVAGVSGGNTTFGGYTAFGGGRGGSDFSCALAAESGGSGGGGSGDVFSSCGAGQSGTPGQGNEGGDSSSTFARIGGGGGGAGGAGQNNADSDPAAAAGGPGVTVFGRSVGGGGGASDYDGPSSPNNATHGGGSGGYYGADGQSGAANTGGGGGANGRFSTSAGAGGSGIVVVRYTKASVGG